MKPSMSMKGLMRFLAVLIVLTLVAAACSSESSETTAADTSPGSDDTTESGGGTGDPDEPLSGTLKYFAMWNEGEPQQIVLQGIIDEFVAANPGVTVEVNWAGREVLTPTRAAISAGDSPDLVDLDAEPLFGALVNTGQSHSLSGMLDMSIPGENATVSDVIPAEFLEMYLVNGEPHLMPYEIITSGIHYDENLATELGITPPETWDEFLASLAVATSSGIPGIQQDGLENYLNVYWLYWLMLREGGPGTFYGAASDPTGELWRSDPVVTAARNVETMVNSGAIADGYEGSAWPLAQQAWAAGDGLWHINGTWIPSETAEYAAEGFKYRMLSFPTTGGGFNTAELYQIGWVVPSGSQNLELAQAFMAFALGKDRLEPIASVAKNLTPRLDISVPSEIQDAADIFAANPAVHRPYDGVQGDFPEYWTTVFLPTNDEFFFGRITADEFIERMVTATVEFWASR